MTMGRRAFLGLAAAAAAHQATRGLPAIAEPIPVNYEDIRIGQWADCFPLTYEDHTAVSDFEISEGFYVGSIHPFFLEDLLLDDTIGPGLRKQLMRVPLSGGEA
jgi:hypothetical protein